MALATKAKSQLEQDKIRKLQAFYSSYFHCKSHFENDGTQNYLVFQPIQRYFKKLDNIKHSSAWKSKGLSNESIKPPTTSNNSFAPALSYVGNKVRVNLDGNCLQQDKITFTHESTMDIYIVYQIRLRPFKQGDFTLENALFGALELVKLLTKVNTNIKKGKDKTKQLFIANGVETIKFKARP